MRASDGLSYTVHIKVLSYRHLAEMVQRKMSILHNQENFLPSIEKMKLAPAKKRMLDGCKLSLWFLVPSFLPASSSRYEPKPIAKFVIIEYVVCAVRVGFLSSVQTVVEG